MRTVRRSRSKTTRTARGSVQVPATQRRTVRLTWPGLSASQRGAPSFWWAGKTHRRTVCAPGPDSPPWTESPSPETLSFWWLPQSPLRTVRPTGPDSPQWTHTLQPETYKFLVLSLISPMDSQPQKPGQSAVHQNCFFKRSSS